MSAIDDFLDGPLPSATPPVTQAVSIDEFLGPVERPGIIGTLAEGFKSTGRAVGATVDTATAYVPGVIERAREQAAAPKAEPLEQFYQDIAARKDATGGDPGLLQALGVVGGAVVNNPKGAGYALLEQLPNSVAALAPAVAGMKGGAAIGSMAGPGGAAVGGVVGGLAGLFAGNTALEVGNKAMDAAQDGTFTPEEQSAALREGATKGAVITGVDALTLGASKWLTGATTRAVERATTRTLADAGVDVADQVAVLAARRNPALVEQIRTAQAAARDTTAAFSQRAARAGAALALETVGEGLGEYLGELAATGQVDAVDAVLESVLSLGQSGAEVAWGASRNATKAAALELNPNAGPISRAAIIATQQADRVAPPVIPEQQAMANGGANYTVPGDWAVNLETALGTSAPTPTEMPSGGSEQADQNSQDEIGRFLDRAPTADAVLQGARGMQSRGATTTTATPQRLIPIKDEATAARRAEVIAQRTGQPHIAIEHPNIEGRFAVVPLDSALAAPRQTEGLDVDSLFTRQTPVPLKHARRLATMLSTQGTEHAVIPNPTIRGFGVAPVEQLSPMQLERWTKHQPTQLDREPAKFIALAQRFEREQANAPATDPANVDARRNEIVQQMDTIERVALARAEKGDATGLPAYAGSNGEGRLSSIDWMTQAEREQFEALRQQLPTPGEEATAAQAKVKRKTRARKAKTAPSAPNKPVVPDRAVPAIEPDAAIGKAVDQAQTTRTPAAPESDPYANLETRPGTTNAQRHAGRSAVAALAARIDAFAARSGRGSAKLLGSGVLESFAASGGTSLVGQKVSSPADLATLAQVFRDPRFETFRVFYARGDEIVGQTAYSSRLPAAVFLPNGLSDQISRDKDAFGADGFWVLHNHPSGKAEPSISDIRLTQRVASNTSGFRGHVVVDNNEYSIIDRRGDASVINAPELASVDFHSNPELKHALLGVSIRQSSDVATIGKALQIEGGHASVIFTRRQGQVQLIMDLPAALLNDRSKLGIARLMAAVRRMARAAGAGGNRFVVLPENSAESMQAIKHLVTRGIFADVVTADGQSMRDTTRAGADFLDKHKPSARVVEEEASPYSTAEEAPAEPVAFDVERATVGDWVKHHLAQNRGWAMGALTRDQIADLYGKDIPQVDRFDRVVQQMDLVRNRMTEQADQTIEQWRKLPTVEADKLADVMHRATLAQFDPDTTDAVTPEHASIRADFDAMSMPAQDLYRTVRNQYRDTLTKIRDGLAGRAERTGSTGRQIADEIRLKFDKYLQEGPYFSLARFGDFILIADRGDDRIVEAFESSLQREKRSKALRAQGFTVKLTARQQYSSTKDGAAGSFIGDVLEKVDALEMPADQKAALMDGLNQLAISSLPDASYRKHFAHRKGTPGFSNDAMRAFASSQMHAGHHLARIRHADELAFLIDEMREEIQSARGDIDVTERQQVVNELTRRLDLMMNPNTHPVTAALGQVGFVMSLGGSIASGLVNMTQTPLVTFPWLGSKFGFNKASAALLTASKDYFGGKWSKWSGFVLADNPNLSDDERGALRHLEEAGLINLTQAVDLAGTANTDASVSKRAFAVNRAMKIVGWTFHTPEVFNRQVSALAAYRLAREAGQQDAEAIESARQTLIRTHFDYSGSNRARFMSGNVARVLTMFKQYSQQMTYLLWRNAYQALKGESPEVRREARRMLVGVGAMHFAAAGSLGLPLGIFGISPLLALISMGMGDDDDPFDWQAEYRNMLADVFGKEGGEAIAHGPVRMLLNVDFASRVGLGDLWIRAPQKDAEGRDLVEAWMVTLLGPVAGYAGQMGTAMKAFDEGKFARGVESMLPKFAAAPLKALRYETEGVRSWRGDDLGITLSEGDIIGTALGFNPTKIAEMYSGRSAVKGREAKLQARREELVNMWWNSMQAGDEGGVQDALAEIRAFNVRNRPFALTPQSLRQSAMAKRRAQLQISSGYHLNRRRDELREYGRFANIE